MGKQMKTLIAITLALMTTAAAAQDLREMIPRTGPFTDKDGKQIGTATFTSGGIYIRDLNGELIASITRDSDGRITMYDPNGKILDQLPAPQK